MKRWLFVYLQRSVRRQNEEEARQDVLQTLPSFVVEYRSPFGEKRPSATLAVCSSPAVTPRRRFGRTARATKRFGLAFSLPPRRRGRIAVLYGQSRSGRTFDCPSRSPSGFWSCPIPLAKRRGRPLERPTRARWKLSDRVRPEELPRLFRLYNCFSTLFPEWRTRYEEVRHCLKKGSEMWRIARYSQRLRRLR